MKILISERALVAGFNEWMRRYVKNPRKFEAEFETVMQFVKERKKGYSPTYGESCVAYLSKIIDELKP